MYDVYTSGRYQFTKSSDLEYFEVIDEDFYELSSASRNRNVDYSIRIRPFDYSLCQRK